MRLIDADALFRKMGKTPFHRGLLQRRFRVPGGFYGAGHDVSGVGGK